MEDFRMRIIREDFGHAVKIWLYIKHEDGSYSCAKPSEMYRYEPGDYITEPTFTIYPRNPKLFLSEIVEEIKGCGVNLESLDAGELKATKRHLEDMRKLVSKKPLE